MCNFTNVSFESDSAQSLVRFIVCGVANYFDDLPSYIFLEAQCFTTFRSPALLLSSVIEFLAVSLVGQFAKQLFYYELGSHLLNLKDNFLKSIQKQNRFLSYFLWL
jgi:hypothetical protein